MCLSSWMLCVIALPLWAAPTGEGAAKTPEEGSAVHAILQGYLAGVESFRDLKCRYQVIRGEASTERDALAGNWRNRVVSRGLLIKRGGDIRFELDFNPATERAAFEDTVKSIVETRQKVPRKEFRGDILSPSSSEGFLGDDELQLSYNPTFRMATLRGPTVVNSGVTLTPLDMGVMGPGGKNNPAVRIRSSLEKGRFARFEGKAELDGREVVEIRCGIDPDRTLSRYFFDPVHGYLPVQVWDYHFQTGELLHKLVITKVRECSGNRWFPERSVFMSNFEKPAGPLDVREIVTTDLDADHTPEDSEFVLTLARETILGSNRDPKSFFHLAHEEKVGLGDLKRLLARAQLASEEKRAIDVSPAVARPIISQRLLLVILLNGLLLLAVSSYHLFRRVSASRARRRAAGGDRS